MTCVTWFATLFVAVFIEELQSAITGIDSIFIDTEGNNEPFPDGWRLNVNTAGATYDQVQQDSSDGRWYHGPCGAYDTSGSQRCEFARTFFCLSHANVAVDWTPSFFGPSTAEYNDATASLFINEDLQATKTRMDSNQSSGWADFVQVGLNESFFVKFVVEVNDTDDRVSIEDVRIACDRITADTTNEPTNEPTIEPTIDPTSQSLLATDDPEEQQQEQTSGSFVSDALQSISHFFSSASDNIFALVLIGVSIVCCVCSCSMLAYCCCCRNRGGSKEKQKASLPPQPAKMDDAMVVDKQQQQQVVEVVSGDDEDEDAAFDKDAVMMTNLSGHSITPRPPPRTPKKPQLGNALSASSCGSVSEHASDAEVMSEVCRQMQLDTATSVGDGDPMMATQLQLQFTSQATDIHISGDSVDGIDNDEDEDPDLVDAMDTMEIPTNVNLMENKTGEPEPDLAEHASADTLDSSMAALGDSFGGGGGRGLDRVNTINLVNEILNAEIPDKEFEIYEW